MPTSKESSNNKPLHVENVSAVTKPVSQPNDSAAAKKKKKKRHSPFRIKMGCIVALRYREVGNDLKRASDNGGATQSPTYHAVWTDPHFRRDDGLALIGRRIRACFPKDVLSNHGASTRIVEGEVVSIVDYETPTQWPYKLVELLVDCKMLEALPFLEQTDKAVDTSIMSSTEKKRQHFENVIRGKDKVTVRVNLADCGKEIDKQTASKHLVAKWVIRKRIPLPSNGKEEQAQDVTENGLGPPKKRRKGNKEKSTTLFVGDKNDSPAEQERNWRWLAGRFDDLLLSSSTARGVSRPPEELSSGMIGEVLKVEPSASNGKTLATVTLRRMLLPEHVKSARRPHHGPVDIFDDADGFDDTFQVPVEELVIISRKFERKYYTKNADADVCSGLNCPVITRSYSYRSDSYARLTKSVSATNGSAKDEEAVEVCHCCREEEQKGAMTVVKTFLADWDDGKLTCRECKAALDKAPSGTCDCLACSLQYRAAQENLFKEQVAKTSKDQEKNGDSRDYSSALTMARSTVQSLQPIPFDLPLNFLEFETLPEPSENPITTKSKRGRKSGKKTLQQTPATTEKKKKKAAGKPGASSKCPVTKVEHLQHVSPPSLEPEVKEEAEEEKVFVPTCSRLTPYDLVRKHSNGSHSKRQMQMNDADASNSATPFQNANKTPSAKKATRKGERESDRVVESKSTSRAARADQRRLKRGVAELGASVLGLDALAGREQQLRFDRSSIHAWGVFADEDINAGDMVVEYRGELIGNAVAEKREKEYEMAKIGSDYMFRIDGFMVCDATKQGNVARFINASCDPNCYTQIITLNGSKRIVIYAKRDIKAGEELCYDYKFPFEFDQSKRIPCHCGAKECRGYMNWDKRYVVLPPANASNTGANGQENA
jgi:histone-lysine N-methyltransferase SETD1